MVSVVVKPTTTTQQQQQQQQNPFQPQQAKLYTDTQSMRRACLPTKNCFVHARSSNTRSTTTLNKPDKQNGIRTETVARSGTQSSCYNFGAQHWCIVIVVVVLLLLSSHYKPSRSLYQYLLLSQSLCTTPALDSADFHGHRLTYLGKEYLPHKQRRRSRNRAR